MSLWDTATGQQTFVFPEEGAQNAYFVAGRGRVAIESANAWAVGLWDDTGNHVATLTGFETAAPVYHTEFSPDGSKMVWVARATDHRFIEAEANQTNISLRTGCFCNPGGGEIALGLSQPELAACFNRPVERLTMDDFRLCIDGKSSGAVRASVGLVSNFEDVRRFVEFAERFVQT